MCWPEDRVPHPQPNASVTQPGDLWLLGKHRILCGNALEDRDYRRLLDDEKAEFVFADAPYNLPIDGNVCGKGSIRHREFAMASGEMSKGGALELMGMGIALMLDQRQLADPRIGLAQLDTDMRGKPDLAFSRSV